VLGQRKEMSAEVQQTGPIARVVVDVALDREFDYIVPEELQGQVKVGSMVLVPFGPRKTEGFVLGFREKSEFARLKALSGLAHAEPLLLPELLDLARWMAEYYCSPIEHAVRTVLPASVRQRGASFRKQLHIRPGANAENETELKALRKRAPKQAAALDILMSGQEMLVSDLVRAAKVPHASLRSMEQKGLVRIEEGTRERDPLKGMTFLKTEALPLNGEQAEALEGIQATLDSGEHRVHLLHGVTGSGKTEVYLQALQHVLDQGKGAIVLVPEISLTPQTVERFRGRFGEGMAVLHSHLSDGERHDEWHRVRRGEARIVVGARSALFAPVRNLGMIVVDEEHEGTYKQEESPRYHARDMAVMRGHREKLCILLGSATPSVETLVNVQNGKYAMHRLLNRADDRQLPVMKVVDMRHQKHEGRPVLFSNDLVEGIRLRLNRAEQTILFLNRRGYSNHVCCPDCGHIPECPDCDVVLTYHRRLGYLRCHFCGHAEPVPPECPVCTKQDWTFVGSGTEKLENTLNKLFPQAKIRRMDSDSMTSKLAYQTVLGQFRRGEIDLLIGTQMIAKGLHFPNVTLVGVVNADSTLNMPDFRAGERAVQLFTQVAGRAGRGDVAGEVILQTYTPTHPAVQAARRGDFDVFIDEEIEGRRMLGYPPFKRMIVVHIRGEDVRKVEELALKLQRALHQAITHPGVDLTEAMPSPVPRIQKRYRYQIVIRSSQVKVVTRPLRAILQHLAPPKSLQVHIDVDALNLM